MGIMLLVFLNTIKWQVYPLNKKNKPCIWGPFGLFTQVFLLLEKKKGFGVWKAPAHFICGVS
jgi:hypothetical protein